MAVNSQSRLIGKLYLQIIIGLYGLIIAATAATADRFVAVNTDTDVATELVPLEQNVVFFDDTDEQRLRFVTKLGGIEPVALVTSVKDRPMANLLISIAIEESRGDPKAVGSSGEQGAWQVKPANWGMVPHDMQGQADQAERIMRTLLDRSKGNKKKALARYNGGTTPPIKSYRYAERVLKRAQHLQLAVNYPLPDYKALREALLDLRETSRNL